MSTSHNPHFCYNPHVCTITFVTLLLATTKTSETER